MISDLFTVTVLIGILSSGIRLATPYLYAAIGETFSQRSGVLNLGVEGRMLLGAFAAFYVSLTTGNLWLGMLAAVLVGAAMGLAAWSLLSCRALGWLGCLRGRQLLRHCHLAASRLSRVAVCNGFAPKPGLTSRRCGAFVRLHRASQPHRSSVFS